MDLSNARALTVKQPWASLIACGAKAVENRSWPIPRTWEPAGPLLIHAGAGVDRKAMTLPYVENDLTKRDIHGKPSRLQPERAAVVASQLRLATDWFASFQLWGLRLWKFIEAV